MSYKMSTRQWWWWMMMMMIRQWWWCWHKNVSYSACHRVVRFSLKDTRAQQISLLTIWHDEYSLFIKWKWIIINVFILVFFLLSRLSRKRKMRGWSCCLRGGRSRRGGGGGRRGRRGRNTQFNFMEIFLVISVWFFCFFISLKIFSVWYKFFFHRLLYFQCWYHRRVHVLKEIKSRLK